MKTLGLQESMELARKHGISTSPLTVAKNLSTLHVACMKTGFPVAMKVVSQKISHKSDAGGVALNVQNPFEAGKVFRSMAGLPGFEGIAVQKMLRGKEIIIGGKRDVQFGPTLLFGLGGIYVEVFRDFKVAICPVNRKKAGQMVRSIRAYPILKGVRGKKGVNIASIEEAIVKASRIMMKDEKIMEIDLNPLIVTKHRAIAVDARAVIDDA